MSMKYRNICADNTFLLSFDRFHDPVIQSASFDMAIMTRLLTLLLHVCITSALVRTLEVSPRVEANHDTFLYLCSLDINEQNVGVLAYRNYQRHYKDKTWLRGTLPFTKSLDGELGSEDGREQPTFWTSTKGCTYRSDFNAGDEEGK
jgi:hypothetical protein